MIEVSMRIKSYSEEDETGTEVTFENQEDPMTSDALVELFIRFATACGFAEQCIALSLMSAGEDLYSLKKEKDDG